MEKLKLAIFRDFIDQLNEIDFINVIKEQPKYLNLLEQDKQLKFLIKNIRYFKYVKNPTNKLIKVLLNIDPFLIKHIKEPSIQVQKQAIKNNWSTIAFINNPFEEAQQLAASIKYQSIQFLNNPSEKTQLISLKKSRGNSISHIKNPTEKVCIYSIKYYINNFFLIKNPSINTQKEVLNQLKGLNESVDSFMFNHGYKKISDSFLLLELYKLCHDEKHKNMIKNSEYWKDDANLVLAVIKDN